MLWSHSNRKTARDCPKWWHHQYVLKDVERSQSDAARRGDVAHQVLERFVHWRMGLGRAATRDETFAWWKSAVDDLTVDGGLVQSEKLDAVWLIEHALPEIRKVFAVLDKADVWGTETKDFYSLDWEPLEDRPEHGHVTIIDLWALVGTTLHVWDWKSGMRAPDWEQLKDYGLAGLMRHPKATKVVASFVWLKEPATDEKTYSRKELTNDHRHAVQAEVMKIEGWREWPATPGKKQCGWCPVKGCEERVR